MFKRTDLQCSFCGKKASEVSKLVAGPRVYICEACVILAKRIMEDASPDEIQPQKIESPAWRRKLSRIRWLLKGKHVNPNIS